jgi:hypothetical protein
LTIPDDVVQWVNGHFRDIDRATALALLEDAVDERGESVEPRLLRCAVVASRGDIDRLTDLVEELRVEWKDVILAGEYESRGGELVQVRDLSQPIRDT